VSNLSPEFSHELHELVDRSYAELKAGVEAVESEHSANGMLLSGSTWIRFEELRLNRFDELAQVLRANSVAYSTTNFVSHADLVNEVEGLLMGFISRIETEHYQRLEKYNRGRSFPKIDFKTERYTSRLEVELNRLKLDLQPSSFKGQFIKSFKSIRGEFLSIRAIRFIDWAVGASAAALLAHWIGRS